MSVPSIGYSLLSCYFSFLVYWYLPLPRPLPLNCLAPLKGAFSFFEIALARVCRRLWISVSSESSLVFCLFCSGSL